MAYRLQLKNGNPRVIVEEYRDGKRHQKHFAKKRWGELGLYEGMTPEEMKAKFRSLNNDAQLKRWMAVNNRIAEDTKREEQAASAFAFPAEVEEFLNDIKLESLRMGEGGEKQLRAHWSAVRTMLVTLKKHPWEMKPGEVPRYYINQGWSASYAKKVHSLFNRWGIFSAQKRAATFVGKWLPRTALREIAAKHEEHKLTNGIRDKESIPLDAGLLATAKQKLKPEQYNWLFISAWLGLRPNEVDDLKEGNGLWWRVVQSEGTRCIDVKQRKLKHLPETKQWKLIPILFPEQETALKLVITGDFKRPLVKTLRALHPGLTCYGGRKHFEYLMIEVKGYSEYAVADWMGHKDTKMLVEKYRNRRKVRLK